MVVSTVLITGSSRGLGLEMVTQLSQRARTIKPQIILATCRDPDRATELQELAAKKPNLVVVKRLDVTRYDEFDRFFAEIEVRSRGWPRSLRQGVDLSTWPRPPVDKPVTFNWPWPMQTW